MKDTPRRANYVLAIFSKALSSAELWGLRAQNSNPCIGIKRYPENHRTRFLKQDEVKRLLDAMIEAETVGLPWNVEENSSKHLAKEPNQRTPLSWQVIGALRLLLQTGARLSEITSLKWSDVDFTSGTIVAVESKYRRCAHPRLAPYSWNLCWAGRGIWVHFSGPLAARQHFHNRAVRQL